MGGNGKLMAIPLFCFHAGAALLNPLNLQDHICRFKQIPHFGIATKETLSCYGPDPTI
jgi:hypothetical protein